jgi:hypothetical protein
MRTTLTSLAITTLFTVHGFGQTDKTFYFSQPASNADITAMVTMIRTVVDLQDITPDPDRQAITAHGPVDKLVAADWVFQQLDHPPAPGPAPEYKIPGTHGEETMRVFRVSPTATNADLTALTTAIRTVADLQRLFPYQSRQAIVGRGAPDKMAAADWMVRMLLPPDGQAPTSDSPTHPSPLTANPSPSDVIQVLRMDPKTTTRELAATVTAIRTVADLQRLFPFESGKAIIGSGDPDKIAVARWLVHELNQQPDADASAVHQTTMPGLIDGVVRLFYTGGQADVTPLATELRSTLGLMRVVPIAPRSAVVLRGRPDQMPAAAALVAKFAVDAH